MEKEKNNDVTQVAVDENRAYKLVKTGALVSVWISFVSESSTMYNM